MLVLGLMWVLAASAQEPAVLRVATKPFAPLVFEQGGEYQGFSIDVLDAIARDEGLRYELIGTTSVSELLEAVESGRADLAVAGVTITAAREQRVDFTHAFYSSGLQVMVREPESTGSLGNVLRAFFTPDLVKLFVTGLVVILCSAHLMWLAERRQSNAVFPEPYLKGIWETF